LYIASEVLSELAFDIGEEDSYLCVKQWRENGLHTY
jgi:hypothetical protein